MPVPELSSRLDRQQAASTTAARLAYMLVTAEVALLAIKTSVNVIDIHTSLGQYWTLFRPRVLKPVYGQHGVISSRGLPRL
jgi:uncharacterized cupredoxin-like copper-binding protein